MGLSDDGDVATKGSVGIVAAAGNGSNSHTLSAFESFQTWGPGARFAAVPTSNCNSKASVGTESTHPITGIAWFAAVTAKPSDNFSLNQSGSINSNSKPSKSQPSTTTTVVPTVANTGPFSTHSSRGVDTEEYASLQLRFNNWHDPISTLLQSTPYDRVTVCDAVAFKSPVPRGLSKVYTNVQCYISESEMHESLPTTTTAKTNSNGGGGGVVAVAYLGDAAHTLDPILAQGAGVAVEDACHLYEALLLAHAHAHAQNNNNTPASTTPIAMITSTLQDYEQRRGRRIQKLHIISNLTQFIGHIEGQEANNLRNMLINLVPTWVKGRLFDLIIKYVSK